MSIFDKIKNGLEWFGKEIGKGIALVPKLFRLAEDAEQTAKDALPLVLNVIEDAGQLTSATAKDSGVFLVSLGALTAALAAAAASKALNISADTAVVAAFESFCSKFNSANVQDVLAAWEKLSADTHKLDQAVIADIQKLEADAK